MREGEQDKERGYVRPSDGYILFNRRKSRAKSAKGVILCVWCADKDEFDEQLEKTRASARRSYAKHRESRKAKVKEYADKNREEIRKYHRDRGAGPNREKYLAQKKKHYQNNKDTYNKYFADRRKADPLFDLSVRCRTRLVSAFRYGGWKKKCKTSKMIGCSWGELMAHLESQFLDGMSWDNRSKWHVDHRIPLAAATTEEEVLKLCHYTNLQPMWAKDNQIKKDKHCPKELAAFLD